jgi:probable F420-dependent oxidoreductase
MSGAQSAGIAILVQTEGGKRTMNPQLNELSFYTLAGAPKSPRDLIAECVEGEAMGMGSALISERMNIKEATTISGAMGAVTEKLGLGTAATNHNTRHPIVTAGHATTMHRLTGGRYMLTIGRSVDRYMQSIGLPPITTRQMEEFIQLMRRLWRGEMVLGYDGVLGRFPALQLDPGFNEDIPFGLVAFGPNTLALGGRACDAVILHTFFTDETLVRSVKTVKDSAEKAGRDPGDVRVWSCFATIGDHLPEPVRLKKLVGRLGTYLQFYGDLMVSTNRWDPEVLKRFREDKFVANFKGVLDQHATTAQLEHVAGLIPDEWLAPSATGTPEQCAQKVMRQFDLGADGVILHGASPSDLAPIVEAYRKIRPAGRFDHLAANPGGRSVRITAG